MVKFNAKFIITNKKLRQATGHKSILKTYQHIIWLYITMQNATVPKMLESNEKLFSICPYSS